MLIINNSTSSSPSAYQKVEKKQIDKGQKTSRKKSSPVNRLITFDPKLFGIMTQIVKIVFTTGITYHCKIWIKFSDKIKEKYASNPSEVIFHDNIIKKFQMGQVKYLNNKNVHL